MTSFSVLICTYNRPDMLSMALNALINRTDEKPDQVVVVNSGDIQADQIVNNYAGKHGVQIELVRTVNHNLATSRNIGLTYCRGQVVAMTDDDAEVFPDWVTKMKRAHAEHPEAGGVGGAVLGADSTRSLLSRIADVVTFSSPLKPGYARTIAGVNISYKQSVIQVVGRQDETLFRGEDVDFNWRVKKLGYEIYYTPEIKVIHHHRPNLRQLIYQFYMYGRAYYLVRQKWPDMYCVFPHKISQLKDLLKFMQFVISTLYDPPRSAMKMPSWKDRVLGFPALYALHLAWKSGIIAEKLIYHSRNS